MKRCLFIIVVLLSLELFAFASNVEGTKTYKDYLFILVHGINGGSYHFNGQDERDSGLRLKQHLEDDLGLKGYVYAYSFKNKNGSSLVSVREFGDRTYDNNASYKDDSGHDTFMNGKCWLDKARQDFRNYYYNAYKDKNGYKRIEDVPESVIPSKYVVITHSMGNMPVRLYVYSKQLLGKQLYGDELDIAKVVFIAPPFTGSDLAYLGWLPTTIFMDYQAWAKANFYWSIFKSIYADPMGYLTNPYNTYQIGKEYSYCTINVPLIFDNIMGQLGIRAVNVDLQSRTVDIKPRSGGGDLLRGSGYYGADAGEVELVPMNVPVIFPGIMEAKLDDDTKEPAYSVIYGKGSPVFSVTDTLISQAVTKTVKYMGSEIQRERLSQSFNDLTRYLDAKDFALSLPPGQLLDLWGAGVKVHDELFGDAGKFFGDFNGEILSLIGSGAFSKLSTSQAKFVALAFSNPYFVFSDDGDSAVSVTSAKGVYMGQQTRALRNANFYSQTYASGFNNYLDNEFPALLAGSYVAYGFMVAGGTEANIAAMVCQLCVLGDFMSHVSMYAYDIQNTTWSHTNKMLKEYDLIEKAVLDTPAIFTIKDLETTAEAKGSPEADAMVFTLSSPEAGYRSIAARGVTEDRNYHGLINMAVPMTLKSRSATGEGARKYVTNMTITEPPIRIVGKLNYLIPNKMKSFEYSFNFSAWQPVTGVNPETGEFVLNNLPFAEGINILATRTINGADIPSHQICRISLNSIPQFVGAPYPEPNTSTSNVYQPVGVTVRKAVLSGDSSEAIKFLEFLADGVDKKGEVVFTVAMGTYTAEAKVKWTPHEPLSEGEHTILVKFQSNVGVSQVIWGFNVDTTAPIITVGTLEPYSPRAPTGHKLEIPYHSSDNYSQFLKEISARVYKGPAPDEDNFVTEITTIAVQAVGDQFITWDGKDSAGALVGDGIYTIKIRGRDEAGNWADAVAQVKVDATPPEIIEAHVSPNPMTKATSEFGLSAQISEPSSVMIKLTNLSENQTAVYSTQGGASVNYTWHFDDPLQPNLRDGVYRIELTAKDGAGNESDPKTFEAVRIDRTPPVIFAQYVDPYILSNVGADPYHAVLHYQLSEANDAADNRQPTSDNLQVTIKLYDESKGGDPIAQHLGPGSLNTENKYNWDANDLSIRKGAYKFQIVAYDGVGNYSTAYASCVKDGIAPLISYPSDKAEVGGTVTIRGTAMDPDWTNSWGFKEYGVYYAKGSQESTVMPANNPVWQTDCIEVPEIYRLSGSSQKNVSVRPVQNDATLAYFHADALENGDYTILILAEEDGGAKYATTRVVTVKNNSLLTSSGMVNPAIKINDLPPAITFNGSNALPIGFTYGGKDINAYIEIVKVSGSGTREAVYYKYFPKLTSNYYDGKPDYQPGNELGYYIWQDGEGWHVRWNGEAGKEHRFNGSMLVAGEVKNFRAIGDGVKEGASLVSWDKKISGGEGGFDFKMGAGQLLFSGYLDNDPATSEDDATTMVAPYCGMGKYQPSSTMVIISGIKDQSENVGQTINWDGKIDTGAFVDSGPYIVRVRAEGADGSGLTVVERNINITTPFELNNVKASTDTFNPLSLPDRVTVSYNMSKDAAIKLKVYPVGKADPLAVIDGGIQLGKTNPAFPHTIYWRGNFPDNEGTQIVVAGEYIFKLVASPVDGSDPKEEVISPGIRIETLGNSATVQLDPIGEQKKYNGGMVYAAEGSSKYFWEAKATGTYYPPVNYQYTLGISGQQKAKVYPYVPFSGIIHRSFNNVDVQVDVISRFRETAYGYVWPQGWKGYGKSKDYSYSRTYTFSNTNSWQEISDQRTVGEIHDANVQTGMGEPWPHVDAIDFTVVFRPQRDPSWVLDVVTFESAAGVSSGMNSAFTADPIPTEKGIFKVTPTWRPWGRENFGAKAGFTLHFELNDGMEYSRLTNRYIPWYGFVNQIHSRNTSDDLNIPRLMTDVSKLGFPGKTFFTVPGVKVCGGNPAQSEYQNVLNNMTSYKTYAEFKAALEAVGRKAYYDGYKGSTEVASGYDAYLKEEAFEFIPVMPPARNDINGNPIPDCGFKQDGLRWTAAVNYEMDDNISPITLKWPYDANEIRDSDKAFNTDRLAALNNNPPSYNISNTAYEIDAAEIVNRENDYLKNNPTLLKENGSLKRNNITGSLRFLRSGYVDNSPSLLNDLINPPDYVLGYTYADYNRSSNLNLAYDKNDKNAVITVSIPASIYAEQWSTADDPVLKDYAGGLVRGGPETFNANGFRADGKSAFLYFKDAYQHNYLKYQNYGDERRRKYAFLAEGNNPESGKPVENPHLVINGWEVKLKDEAGQVNQDLEMRDEYIHSDGPDPTEHYFQTKLKYQAKERKYVKITGRADSPYELLYFDGKQWVSFDRDEPVNGQFVSFWDVGHLCGKYTVLLKTAAAIASQDVYIGDIVYNGLDEPENRRVASAYKRAEVFFKPTSFNSDQFASVTPVTMSEIYIRNKPIIKTHGPILELKPSPYKFKTPAEGEDLRPYVRFLYTADDLKEGYGIIVLPSDPDWKTKTQDLWIHQVTADGDLQLIQDKEQELLRDENGNQYFAFEAAVDHFSTYTLLNGKFSLSAPMVFAERYITNKDNVTIYGTAEPGSVLAVYVTSESRSPLPFTPSIAEGLREGLGVRAGKADTAGNFRFENIPLPQEGENYIYVTSHPEGSKDVMTWSDVTIVKDTLPPSVEATPNLYAFSPNGDGKYDTVDFTLKMNEGGELHFILSTRDYALGNLVNLAISAEAEKDLKLMWSKDGFELYRRNPTTGIFTAYSLVPSAYLPVDGTYTWTVYAIDEAGNISNNVIGQTVVDTTSPTILSLTADPNPFTPNGDGIKDTTTFSYKFSEPAYVSQSIFREGEKLFRAHEGATGGFAYPTVMTKDDRRRTMDESSLILHPSSIGSWEWDGRGSRNELLGGTYTYSIVAEDNVGNAASSEVKQIVVDCEPTLIPYAYAEPDPFAPVNPANSFTEIKYYLARDNLKINLLIMGQEGKTVKILANEAQGKGEHAIKWYGDFDSNYDGPAASASKYRVADGSYEFKLKAEDLNEPNAKPAEITNTVLVDNVPPHILIKDLAVDYLKKTATVIYSVPESASVEVSVRDKGGSILGTLVSGETQAAGEYKVSYNLGSGEAGENYFNIIAVDHAKNTDEQKSQVFSTIPNLFQVVNFAAIPSTFTPNGDGFTDQTRINYGIAGGTPPYAVTINILSASGSTVRRLIENENQDAGNYSFYWDGGDDGRRTIDDGRYECVITATDRVGTKDEGRGTIVVVSTRPTVDILTDLATFSPNGDGAKDTVTFNYSISYPTLYVTGEALVKIEVLNASSEAVWSKVFNHTAGNYSYVWDGKDEGGRMMDEGRYYVRVSGEDALGQTSIPKVVPLTVDYGMPESSDFMINPPYAQLGTKVAIDLSFSEQLTSSPEVMLTFSDSREAKALFEGQDGNNYHYSYTVLGLDPEGPVQVKASSQDFAGNASVKEKTFVIDNTRPAVSEIQITPNPASVPAVSGKTSLKFNISEPLTAAPLVYVTQKGAPAILTPVGGQWTVNGGQCEARYDVFPGYDGTARVTIEVTDQALNTNRFYASFEVDTVKPVIGNIQSEIGSNPEFVKFAKEGAAVAINFKSSEPLKFNPEVKVNNNPATYSGGRLTADGGQEYAYQYTVTGSDVNGNAAIAIAGEDPAGNEGTVETASSAESFVIDLENPIVVISDQSSWIANPSHFSTNANPDGTDIPRSTRFFYTLAENSKVTVKVYKVGDAQTTYRPADFNAGNQVATLVNDIWQVGGVRQEISWSGTVDGGGDAGPGKYAFIVEGWDRAGNLTLKKWGGTVWVQNNVLTVKEPEQKDFAAASISPTPEVNPDPHYISPGGNSLALVQKRARFYFMVNLSLNPANYTEPEKIEAFTLVGASTKRVGKYSVKVCRDSGLTSLVRTVTSDADVYSGALMYEDWNGTADDGRLAADGTYYMVVDVRDYAGNAAVNNLLTRTVVVDNTAPEVRNLSVAPYYFSPGGTNSSIKTTTLTYEVYDNSGKAKVTVSVSRESVPVATLLDSVQKNNGRYDLIWDGGGVGNANGSGFKDGIYTLKVSAIDEAGNRAEGEGIVMVDTISPSGTLTINSGNPVYTSTTEVSLYPLANFDTSGVESMSFREDSQSWTTWEAYSSFAKRWNLALMEGEKRIYVKLIDRAGNFSANEISDTITLDTKKPRIVNAPVASPITYTNGSTTISFVLTDTNEGVSSDVKSWKLVIRNSSGGQVAEFTGRGIYIDQTWSGRGIADGDYYYYVVAEDGAGNLLFSNRDGYGGYKPYGGSETYYRVQVDQSLPSASIASPVSGRWYRRGISVDGTASDTNPGNYIVEYSPAGVNAWIAVSNAIYPEQAAINGDTNYTPPILTCATSVSAEISPLYLGDVSVMGNMPGQYPPPSGYPSSYQLFEITEAGNYLFETYGSGNGHTPSEMPFGWSSNHYLRDEFGRDMFPPIRELNQSQLVHLNPGRYVVAVNMQIGAYSDGQTKIAGSRMRRIESLLEPPKIDEKQFALGKRQSIRIEPYYVGTGAYSSEHWVCNSMGEELLHITNLQFGGRAEINLVLEAGTYTVRTRGTADTNGSTIIAGTRIYTNYAEWIETKNFNVQYDQDVTVQAVSNSSAGGGSEHWLFDSNGNQLFYANSVSNSEAKHLAAGTYILRTKGWASFGGNYSYTRVLPQKNNVINGKLAEWSTDGMNGDYDLRLTVNDVFRNSSCVTVSNVRLDNVSPSLSDLLPKTFNPYVDGSARVDFTASDPSPSAGFGVSNITARIRYGSNVVRNLTVTDDGSRNYHISWDGMNDAGDYENEGNYTLEIAAADAVGNPAVTKTATIELRDDQRITNNATDSNNPSLILDGDMRLRWIEGGPDDSASDHASPSHATVAYDWWETGWGGWTSFTIDHDQTVKITLSSGGNVGDQAMEWNVDDDAHTSHTTCDLANPKEVWMTAGTHQIRAYVAANAVAGHHFADVYAYFTDRKFNQYSCISSNAGKNWGSISGPEKVDSYSTGPTVRESNSYIHRVYIQTEGTHRYLWYERRINDSTVWSVKISNIGYAYNPSLAKDASDNCYVAWQDMGNDNFDIYFQKIPVNFARATGTFKGASVTTNPVAVVQSTTLESPVLISPEKDKQNVLSLRPTFQWKHHVNNVQCPISNYQLDVAKNDAFTIAHQQFTKSANTGSQANPTGDPTLYNFSYSIHEFDPGLDRDTYYWRVTALTTNEAATSETWSFRIQPDLTLTGVTNYPNPFNPNRERTKIRYRLGAEADEVKIRIYDITGQLVVELNGTTNGEGASVWSKYNDVEWDGRNGRGDMVVNGIYPFEVTARLGDKSVSGRGKMAVLK